MRLTLVSMFPGYVQVGGNIYLEKRKTEERKWRKRNKRIKKRGIIALKEGVKEIKRGKNKK